MSKQFTHDQVLAVIRKEVDGSSMTAVAARIGVSTPFLSDILAGKRLVSETVAKAFGFEREVTTTMVFRKRAA